MPTGVHLRDARQRLFDAAERVLLRDGPNGLTSRAVTDEAACAKGVLHRHFTDFDAFLTELVLDRAAQLETQARALRGTVGTGTVADNLTGALTTLFGPVPVAIIPLITFRDELRAAAASQARRRHRDPRPGHDGGLRLPGRRTRNGPHLGRRRHRLTHPLPGRRRSSPVRRPRLRPTDHGNSQQAGDHGARRRRATTATPNMTCSPQRSAPRGR